MTCRIKVRTGRRHFCGPFHRELVTGYRLARHAQELRAESATADYGTELQHFYTEVERPLTFKDWLIGSRRVAA